MKVKGKAVLVLIAAITALCNLWQALERIYYGSTTPREVDTIIIIAVGVLLVGAYQYGKYDRG